MHVACLPLVSHVFAMVALACLTWQVVLVSTIYFGYSVSTQMTMRIPDTIVTESINFCCRYTDIIDYDKMNRETGRSWKYTLDDNLVRDYQRNLTIAEIFEYSPVPESILEEVVYRTNDSYNRHEVIDRKCYDLFLVERYMYLEYMCYKISYREDFQMPYTYFAVTPTSPGKVFEVFFNRSNLITRTNYIKIVIHRSSITVHPHRSISKTSVLQRRWNETTKSSRYNRFKNFKIRITTDLMPAPYESDCFDYHAIGFNSDAECTHVCLKNKTLSKWDKMPFSVIVNESTDKHMISYADVTDPEFAKQLLRMQKVCESVCHKQSCHYGIALTVTDMITASRFSVRLNVPSRAWVYVETSARLSLVEFLTYVMGILSTYTGLSVLSFSPPKIIIFVQSKVMRRHWIRSATEKTSLLSPRGKEQTYQPSIWEIRSGSQND